MLHGRVRLKKDEMWADQSYNLLTELSENTFFLLTLTLRSSCCRKSAPRIGTDTGANWNVHVPKRRGIVLEPEQITVDPSAVSKQRQRLSL